MLSTNTNVEYITDVYPGNIAVICYIAPHCPIWTVRHKVGRHPLQSITTSLGNNSSYLFTVNMWRFIFKRQTKIYRMLISSKLKFKIDFIKTPASM